MLEINRVQIVILLLFMVIDIVTGLIKAIINKDLKSSKMREGIMKKALEMLISVVGFGCDVLTGLTYLGNGCVMFFCAMEGISIMENSGEYIPLPDALRNVLDAIKEKGGNEND